MLKFFLGALVLVQSVGVLAFGKSRIPPVFRGLAAVTAVAALAFLAFELAGGRPFPISAPGAEEAGSVRAGETFRDCADCPEMVVVPAGSFMMGSWFDEVGRLFNEPERHRVTIPVPFAMGRFEVTVEEWGACREAGGCPGGSAEDRGSGQGKRPVTHVSWDDARAYARWLSRRTGRTYRLPSEAEWEYAARGGTASPFSFGETISADRANYDARFTYDLGPRGLFRGRPLPVGRFAANRFGIHDMHGNVSEWTQDCWNFILDKETAADGTAWLKGECRWRVVRGGSWADEPQYLRSAARTARLKDLRGESYLGFRVVREIEESAAAGGKGGQRQDGAP